MVVAGLIAASGLAASACGDPVEPEESTTSPLPSKSTDEPGAEEAAATAVFEGYWSLTTTADPSKPPSKELKGLITPEYAKELTKFAAMVPSVKAEGQDKKTASSTTVSLSDTPGRATVEVCYSVHRRLIATRDGEDWSVGDDLRSDPQGKAIPQGTTQVNKITMIRTSDSDWKVSGDDITNADTCTITKQQS